MRRVTAPANAPSPFPSKSCWPSTYALARRRSPMEACWVSARVVCHVLQIQSICRLRLYYTFFSNSIFLSSRTCTSSTCVWRPGIFESNTYMLIYIFVCNIYTQKFEFFTRMCLSLNICVWFKYICLFSNVCVYFLNVSVWFFQMLMCVFKFRTLNLNTYVQIYIHMCKY